MQTLFKTLCFGILLASTALSASPAPDPVIGTWKLNLAKSTFSPGPPPKSQVRTYAAAPDGGIALTVTTTAADGKESTMNLTFNTDGKPYPAAGNPDFDSVSVKRVSTRTVHSTEMKAGAIVGTGVRKVSKDGKTLTFAQKGTDAKGTAYDDVAVYDRQ